MPASLTYPGVYIEELPSGVRTIVGVSTSLTAFGGLWEPSRMSFAVQQYFQNGGGEAIVVRVTGPNAAAATFTLPGGLVLAASSPGSWADDLTVAVNHDVNPDAPDPTVLFNVEVTRTVQGATVPVETLRNLSVEPASPEFVTGTLEQRSEFLE